MNAEKNVEYVEPMIEIDATPNWNYPLRILRAYRMRCNSVWSSSSTDVVENPLMKQMNNDQKKRAAFLDWAIQVLVRAGLDK